MSRPYYIFFDLDGVLINGFHSNPDKTNRWDRNIEQDLGIKQEELTANFFETSFMDVIIGKQDCKEALQEALPSFSESVSAEQLMQYWFEKDSEFNQDVMAIVQALSELPEVKLYIATNQEHYRADFLWNDAGLKNYFEDIYYSARLGCLKEDPDYFSQIVRELHLPDKNVLFFDDSPKNIDVAKQFGWDAVIFDDINDLATHPVINSLLLGKENS